MKEFITSSDRGGVLVGNGQFEILIPNWFGDGDTMVKIMTKEEFEKKFNYDNYHYWSCITGQFNIYEDDCCADIIKETLNGSYSIYQYKNPWHCGTVLFVKKEE